MSASLTPDDAPMIDGLRLLAYYRASLSRSKFKDEQKALMFDAWVDRLGVLLDELRTSNKD